MKKEFLRNFAGLASSNLINLLIPLVTMPYLSRVLGSDSYGVVLLFSSVTIFTMIITDYSTNITGVRDCAEALGDHDKIRLVYEKNQNTD
ncbi:oligosaccharide flippase family protein [Erwinia rhapontici]|uniref:lipopolysaccharide biosynthesis protein n=1 Tax=Erwinia rhapontici TaxID=55212 RepID=UPI001D0D88BA|nr:oligosaccharide flippase family protein [Erwinia rhapontici]UDQ78777.1 oligosaccharide flippase family protein [Erwinia rhapontici]